MNSWKEHVKPARIFSKGQEVFYRSLDPLIENELKALLIITHHNQCWSSVGLKSQYSVYSSCSSTMLTQVI